MTNGKSIIGQQLPIRCLQCGAVAIDWDHRFDEMSIAEITKELASHIAPEAVAD